MGKDTKSEICVDEMSCTRLKTCIWNGRGCVIVCGVQRGGRERQGRGQRESLHNDPLLYHVPKVDVCAPVEEDPRHRGVSILGSQVQSGLMIHL
jgi:hypothetical protein